MNEQRYLVEKGKIHIFFEIVCDIIPDGFINVVHLKLAGVAVMGVNPDGRFQPYWIVFPLIGDIGGHKVNLCVGTHTFY